MILEEFDGPEELSIQRVQELLRISGLIPDCVTSEGLAMARSRLVESARDSYGWSSGIFLNYGSEADELSILAIAGFGAEEVESLRTLLAEAGTGHVREVVGNGYFAEDVSATCARAATVRELERLRICAIIASPIVAPGGEFLGILALFNEKVMTASPVDPRLLHSYAQIAADMERVARSLHAAELTLEKKIEEEKRARLIAEAASKSKDEFLAVVSHELRTPLSPVLVLVESLETDSRLPPDVRSAIQIIHRNVQLEARLINDLLDISRISHGKIALRFEPLDLSALLGEVIGYFAEDAYDKRLKIELDAEYENFRVQGDQLRLQQAFWNIIRNAVKFTPAGGSIFVRVCQGPHGSGRVEITDTGMGIDPDELPYIFNAFEQGETSVTRRYGGLGLGLAISRAMIALHKGNLSAHSDGVGKGATFVAEFPADEIESVHS